MILRSKKEENSKASNLINIKIDKYEYWFDLLDLRVYDENNNSYTLKEIFEKPFTNEDNLVSVSNDINRKISDTINQIRLYQDNNNRQVNILSETVRELNKKVALLEENVRILENSVKKYLL